MAEPLIPDRSDEPALQDSLDHGPLSTTAAQSEDVVRDAGKKPRVKGGGGASAMPPEKTVEDEEDEDDDDFDDEDDDEDDDSDDDDDDDDDEEDEEDNAVGTDEHGREILRSRGMPASGQTTRQDTEARPDVSSDRVPATDAEPEGSLDKVKTAPLKIQDIESLEDDAKGG